MSRPIRVQGTKWTFGCASRSSIVSYSFRRSFTCQRGSPSSIFPYGRAFCSNTTDATPLSARIPAASAPAVAPPTIATT